MEMDENDVCCGFGGTFAVKYSEISGAIVEREGAACGGNRRADTCWPGTSDASSTWPENSDREGQDGRVCATWRRFSPA